MTSLEVLPSQTRMESISPTARADMDSSLTEMHSVVYCYLSSRKIEYLDQHTTCVMMFATVNAPTTPDIVYQKYLA
jgi:hypothetical protein